MGIDSTIYVMHECGDYGWLTEAMINLPRGLTRAIMGKYEYLDIPGGTKIWLPEERSIERRPTFVVGSVYDDLYENWSCTTVGSLREVIRRHLAAEEPEEGDHGLGFDHAALAILDKLWPDTKVLFHWC